MMSEEDGLKVSADALAYQAARAATIQERIAA
jgi:hypothetical protein